tara:strand:+ start:809 stop:979 length:171 start_codon:yes stop_codon:yes gene_type:complete
MNDIIEDHYIKYFECLSGNDKDICDKLYLGDKKEVNKNNKYKNTWRFVNRGNFIKK